MNNSPETFFFSDAIPKISFDEQTSDVTADQGCGGARDRVNETVVAGQSPAQQFLGSPVRDCRVETIGAIPNKQIGVIVT